MAAVNTVNLPKFWGFVKGETWVHCGWPVFSNLARD